MPLVSFYISQKHQFSHFFEGKEKDQRRQTQNIFLHKTSGNRKQRKIRAPVDEPSSSIDVANQF